MRITDITCHLLTGLWNADPGFPAELHSTALAHVQTDTEFSGWGEITLGYFAPEAVPSLVDYFKPVLTGKDPFAITALTRAMQSDSVWWSRSGAGRSVLGGIEMALWDIKGKALGVPVYELLGGAAKSRVAVYASGGPSCWPLDENVRKVEFYRSKGFRAIKLSVHFYQWSAEARKGLPRRLETVKLSHAQKVEKVVQNFDHLRRAFGDELDLAIDGHEGGSPNPIPVQEAVEISQALAPHRLIFYEEPLAYTDIDGYVELRARSRVPIAGGESLCGVEQFHPFIRQRGLHIVQPDVGFTGGIGETQRIILGAAAENMSAAIHTGGAIGPAMAASWHLAAACPTVDWLECVVAPSQMQTEFLTEPLAIRDGTVGIPTSPGLGVRITPELLAKYPFVPGSGERT
jgi:L-alanine-DL-glutamate epimerase-like enolase superfamily enzyme